jgi:Ribonucleases P/MRP protein subunit POP1
LLPHHTQQWLNHDSSFRIMEDGPATTTTTTTSSTKWLVTHLWHAKRFHMATMWDKNGEYHWLIPIEDHGQH